MYVHGGPSEVVAGDGVDLAETARYAADTVNVGPGQRFDVIWTSRRAGDWLLHCHIAHHTTNIIWQPTVGVDYQCSCASKNSFLPLAP